MEDITDVEVDQKSSFTSNSTLDIENDLLYSLYKQKIKEKMSLMATLPEPRPVVKYPETISSPLWPEDMYSVDDGVVLDQMPMDEKIGFKVDPESSKVPSTQRKTEGEIVYKCIYRKRSGLYKPFYKLKDDTDETLLFESRFESGNLQEAMKINEHEYDLQIRKDLNTRGHNHWYYFQVKNTRAQEYTFNIINMQKQNSLYNRGLKPLMFSIKKHKANGDGWKRVGKEIKYYKQPVEDNGRCPKLYTLSFKIDLEGILVYMNSC